MSITLKMANGDLYVDAAGRFLPIDGIEKCAQDIAESLLNNRDSEFPEWFNGSDLYRLTNGDYLRMMSYMQPEELIHTYVEEAIDRLIELQDFDAYVDEDESISEIALLDVRAIGNMTYAFFLVCLTDSQEPVRVGFTVDLKQQIPAAILGDIPDAAGPNATLVGGKTFM